MLTPNFLTVLLLTAALQCSGVPNATFRTSRKLSSVRVNQWKRHIWGRCRWWQRGRQGCKLAGQSQCSDHLSLGPRNADVEIHIGNLPASTSNQDVHLQWWSARKSELEYDVISKPLQSRVYWSVFSAYPRYDDDDFNGGNVRVNESGIAVVRVQAPSAYRFHRWVSYPHIHLRLCSGSQFIHSRKDTIYFTDNGLHLTGGCQINTKYAILSAVALSKSNTVIPAYTATANSASAASIQATSSLASTTHQPPTSTLMEASTLSANQTYADATVVEIDPNNEPVASSRLAGLIRTARQDLDLDALEFSPVYQCFMIGKLFDYFTSECATTCPNDKDVHHGQCVLPEMTGASKVDVKAGWQFSVECEQQCLIEKPKVTLHHISLEVADYLDIPFQEVEHVKLSWDASTGRRLNQESQQKVMFLTIKIVSSRITAAQGEDFRNNFVKGAAEASRLIGLMVTGINPSLLDSSQYADFREVTTGNNPYAPAYQAVEPKYNPEMIPRVSMHGVPPHVIFCIAAVVLVVGLSVGCYCAIRRTRAYAPNFVAKGKEIQASNEG